MQAIIMAAGKGSRLGELTKDQPKAFLEIRGIPMIDYNLALLKKHGVSRMIVVTGYENQVFEAHFKGLEEVICVYNPFYEQMNVLGSFFMGQEYLEETDTLYLHADTLCAPDIFADVCNAKGDIILPVDFKQCDEEAMKIRREDGRVVEISKEIPCEAGEGEFIGIAKLSGSVIEPIKAASKKLMKGKKFSSYFEAAIQELIDEGRHKIETVETAGRFWGEVDFLEDYQYVCDHFPEELYQIAMEMRK